MKKTCKSAVSVEMRKAVAFDSIAMFVTAAGGLIDVSRLLDKHSSSNWMKCGHRSPNTVLWRRLKG